MRNDILEKKNEIMNMINDNEPLANICRMLECKPDTLNRHLKKMNISYNGNRGLKGKKTDPKRKTALEYLENNIVVTPRLRRKLIEDGIKEDKCEKCGRSEWMGQKLTLHLHHLDGNRFNNVIENLEIQCPNCHSLTPNHSKKKKYADVS